MSDIIELKDSDDWVRIKTESKGKNEVIILKYSPICTVSFTAGKILEAWLAHKNIISNLTVAKVNVIDERSVSKLIEEETGIKHESPQLIWFDKSGKVKWHGSHFMISENSLLNQMNNSMETAE